jgi:GDP-4-dehydro-6-deoxy-D-mannose reductase
VTGAGGFAGRWLVRELANNGHEVIQSPPHEALDISDYAAVRRLVADAEPDGAVHLAGVSLGSDAAEDPDRAFRVNVGGTLALLEALRARRPSAPVVVVGSSDVYAAPNADELPLSEDAPLGPTRPYALSKLAAEALAVHAAAQWGQPTAVARAFNHTGSGQREDFVVPALAGRIVAAAADGRNSIKAGNVDVRRDFSDVRDIVRAYRLVLEGLADGRVGKGRVFNLASGRSVAIRELITDLARLAGLSVEVTTDPTLVRRGEASEIRGDPSRIARELGWTATIPLGETLRDVLVDAQERYQSTRATWA